jgi:hypothetical protein
LILLAAFSQLYIENWEQKAEQKDLKMCSFFLKNCINLTQFSVKTFETGRVAQMIDYLSSKCGALSSSPSTIKIQKQTKQKNPK